MKNQISEEPQKIQVDTFAQLERQQAITILKQKVKQNKGLQNKINKLETKYIDIFNEHKRTKKDYTVFVSLMKHIFPDFQQKPIGSYELQWLQQLWKKRQSSFTEKLRTLIQQTTKQKNQIKKQLENQMQNKIKQLGSVSKSSTQALISQIQSLKKTNKILTDQINTLQKKLDNQNQQISKVTKQKLKIQHQLNSLRKKEIQKELIGTNEDSKINEDNLNRRNQFLALRQQVQNLLSGRDDNRKEIKNLKNQLQIKNEVIQQKERQINRLIGKLNGQQKIQFKVDINSQISQPKKNNGFIKHQKNKENSTNLLKDQNQDMIHRQYFKNILLRYFKSCIQGDEGRSQILLNIIVTILKFNSTEVKFVQNKKNLGGAFIE